MLQLVDGNEIAARVSFALSDACFVYPITPSTGCSELIESLARAGQKNIFGKIPEVRQMQSELGSIAACHGAAHAGAIPTTATSSQGLLLMLPNLLKMAGERRPTVINVAARTLATHSLSIHGDHSDIYQIRSTGALILGSSNVAEVQFNAVLAQLLARVLRVPVVHFYDGFLTSHEQQGLRTLTDQELKQIFGNFEKKWAAALSRKVEIKGGSVGLVSGPGESFQMSVALRHSMEAFPEAVEQLTEFLQQEFQSIKAPIAQFNPIHAEEPEKLKHLVVAMGSGADVLREAVRKQPDAGVLQVTLFRPVGTKALEDRLKQLKSLETVTILDRAVEASGPGVLASDIRYTLSRIGSKARVLEGSYGVSGRDFGLKEARDVLDNARSGTFDQFSVGINDDVSRSSLNYLKGAQKQQKCKDPETCQGKAAANNANESERNETQIKLCGFGSEGLVSAAGFIAAAGVKQGFGVQKNSRFDAKKSGGLTESDLRIRPMHGDPIRLHAPIGQCEADLLYLSDPSVLARTDPIASLKHGGTFMSGFDPSKQLSARDLARLKKKQAKVLFFDMQAMEKDLKLPATVKLNGFVAAAVAQAAGLKVDVGPYVANLLSKKKRSEEEMKQISAGIQRVGEYVRQVDLQGVAEQSAEYSWEVQQKAGQFAMDPTSHASTRAPEEMKGDLPVSAFAEFAENAMMSNETAVSDKLNRAPTVPEFLPEACIQCGKCSLACPHGCIRSYLLTDEEMKSMGLDPQKYQKFMDQHRFLIGIQTEHCTGCGLCSRHCPAQALPMAPNGPSMQKFSSELIRKAEEIAAKPEYSSRIPAVRKLTPKGLQFQTAQLTGNSACPGCGQVGYMALLQRMLQIKNDGATVQGLFQGTGCPLVYLGQPFTQPVSKNVLWANSLFEDTNEAAYGYQAVTNKPVWVAQGDGAAYDINFSGLDFNASSGRPMKVLILDNNGYANTGMQKSSGSLPGSTMKLGSPDRTTKDLVQLLGVGYRNVFIATVTQEDPARTLEILRKAHEYPGPAIVIAYSPCIGHGSEPFDSLKMDRRAVLTGVFPLVELDPRRPRGQRLQIQSKKTMPVTEMKEKRFTDYPRLQSWVDEKWTQLQQLAEFL